MQNKAAGKHHQTKQLKQKTFVADKNKNLIIPD